LAVQNAAVRNDNDGVKNPPISSIVQYRQLMRQPGDREAFPASGRVLDETALPRTSTAGISNHPAHGIELVIAGKYQKFLSRLPALVIFFFNFMNELPKEVEHTVTRPYTLPKVTRCETGLCRRYRWVSSSTEASLIERQKPSFLPSQPCRHES